MPNNKAKGSKAERELISMFNEHGWRAVRVAGSGVKDESPCDIIVGKIGKKGYVVECKSSKKKTIYITKQQIEDFIVFSKTIGLNSVIAARFNYEGWYFLDPSFLKDTGKYWALSLEQAKKTSETPERRQLINQVEEGLSRLKRW